MTDFKKDLQDLLASAKPGQTITVVLTEHENDVEEWKQHADMVIVGKGSEYEEMR